MKLNKDDIIKDGEDYFFIFCILCKVVYVYDIKKVNCSVSDVKHKPCYEMKDVLKYYKKVEFIKKVECRMLLYYRHS